MRNNRLATVAALMAAVAGQAVAAPAPAAPAPAGYSLSAALGALLAPPPEPAIKRPPKK